MKQNMLVTMNRLEIDIEMRDLIGQLWKHCYITIASCEGHSSSDAYVLLFGGDGWFEKNSLRYGLRKIENGNCCNQEFLKYLEEIQKLGLDPIKVPDKRKVCRCGAGVNGYSCYRRKLS
jgi:hypothetical protein